jgi:hypothetical protein
MSRISVYLDDGRVFEYEVADAMKAREHVSAIIKTGYRHTAEGTADLEWYPPHRVVKVKASGAGETSAYRDQTRAT